MRKILKKYINYNFISTIMAIFGIVLSFYFYFMANYKELSVTLVNKIDLVNVYEPLNNLDIKYKDTNIYDSNLSLELYTIKFENLGNTISEKDYDSKIDFGINVENAQIIEVRKVRSDDKYLEKSINPILMNVNKITFDKRIIDSGSSFNIDFVVLKEKSKNIKITINGKIADIKEEIILKKEESKTDMSTIALFFDKYTSISIIILIVAIFLLGLLELIILALLFHFFEFLKDAIIEYKSSNYFGRQIKKYSWHNDRLPFEISDFIPHGIDLYEKINTVEFIDSLLSQCYKKQTLGKIKLSYDSNILSFLGLVNEIRNLDKELKILNDEIKKTEDEIIIVNSIKLSDIKEYRNLNLVPLELRHKFENNISEEKYIVFKSFVTYDLEQLLQKKNNLNESLKNKFKECKELLFIRTNEDIDSMINNKIILEKDLSGAIIEEKTFITKLNEVIQHFNIEE